MKDEEGNVEKILSALPGRTIGVFGDLFLDRYLDIDATLTEPSIETGLEAYQVVRVRCFAGAAGTVINNLSALGVGRIVPISVLGDDGEGYELRQALRRLAGVDASLVISTGRRRTPAYTKPMLEKPGEAARELNRLDIKNRQPLPLELETQLLESLDQVWPGLDALVVLDQVSETDCGVITSKVRQRLADLVRPGPRQVYPGGQPGANRPVSSRVSQAQPGRVPASRRRPGGHGRKRGRVCLGVGAACKPARLLHLWRGRHPPCRAGPGSYPSGIDPGVSGVRADRPGWGRRQHECRDCLRRGSRRNSRAGRGLRQPRGLDHHPAARHHGNRNARAGAGIHEG